jgi:hypothetical protein
MTMKFRQLASAFILALSFIAVIWALPAGTTVSHAARRVVTEAPIAPPTATPRILPPTQAQPTATPRPAKRVCKWQCINGRWCLVCKNVKR